MNRESSDIPTLISYLKSTQVLTKTAKKNNISPFNLSQRLSITIPRNQGVTFLPRTLRVSIDGSNKNKMKQILDDLSQEYLKIASERKSKKLSEGIRFLDNERPKLLQKVNSIQGELENFRLKNEMINPVSEGQSLTSRIEGLENIFYPLNQKILD